MFHMENQIAADSVDEPRPSIKFMLFLTSLTLFALVVLKPILTVIKKFKIQ